MSYYYSSPKGGHRRFTIRDRPADPSVLKTSNKVGQMIDLLQGDVWKEKGLTTTMKIPNAVPVMRAPQEKLEHQNNWLEKKTYKFV